MNVRHRNTIDFAFHTVPALLLIAVMLFAGAGSAQGQTTRNASNAAAPGSAYDVYLDNTPDWIGGNGYWEIYGVISNTPLIEVLVAQNLKGYTNGWNVTLDYPNPLTWRGPTTSPPFIRVDVIPPFPPPIGEYDVYYGWYAPIGGFYGYHGFISFPNNPENGF